MDIRWQQARPSLSIISVATGRYLKYWEDLVDSFAEYCDFFDDIQWVLLTDQELQIRQSIRESLGDNLVAKFVPHSDWPFPTLLRYKFISENSSLLNGVNTLYLDADMRAISRITNSQMDAFFDSDRMTFVQHPGYFRTNSKPFCMSPKKLVSYLFLKIRFGGVGHWETNRKSQAFIPRSKRVNYFCGGTWGGPTPQVIRFSETLRQRTDEDLAKGIIAVFHDESHLNWFAANSHCKHESPSWCFEPTYQNLHGIEPLIEAVNKSQQELWER